MSRKLNPSEFYSQLGEILGVDYDTSKDKWIEIVSWWIEEIQQYGGVSLPLVGEFKTKYKPAEQRYMVNSRHIYDKNEPEMELRELPERLNIWFSLTLRFKQAVNGTQLNWKEKADIKKELARAKQKELEEQKQLDREQKAQAALQELLDKKGK